MNIFQYEDKCCWLLPPPPTIIFTTELEIDHYDGDLWAGNAQYDEDEKEEPEEIIELVLVDSGEYEKKLDETGSKGQDSSHEGADNWR